MQVLSRLQQHQDVLQICHYCVCSSKLPWLLGMVDGSSGIIVYCLHVAKHVCTGFERSLHCRSCFTNHTLHCVM